MTPESREKLRRTIEMAYGAPSDRTRPRWKKNGKRWVRSVPFDMPGPYFDIGIATLFLLSVLISLFV